MALVGFGIAALLGCSSGRTARLDGGASGGQADVRLRVMCGCEPGRLDALLTNNPVTIGVGEDARSVTVEVTYVDAERLVESFRQAHKRRAVDVVLAEDARSLVALAKRPGLRALPIRLQLLVPPALRSPGGRWTGITGDPVGWLRSFSHATAPPPFPGALTRSLRRVPFDLWRGKLGWLPSDPVVRSMLAHVVAADGERGLFAFLAATEALAMARFSGADEALAALRDGDVVAVLGPARVAWRLGMENGETLATDASLRRAAEALSPVETPEAWQAEVRTQRIGAAIGTRHTSIDVTYFPASTPESSLRIFGAGIAHGIEHFPLAVGWVLTLMQGDTQEAMRRAHHVVPFTSFQAPQDPGEKPAGAPYLDALPYHPTAVRSMPDEETLSTLLDDDERAKLRAQDE